VTRAQNLWADLPEAGPDEQLQTLARRGTTRVERIVSHGHASPPGFWYDQPQDEWVMVASGRAALELEGEAEPMLLGPGDFVHIPARRRHRVAWTAPDQPTVWLAVHL
jgi:cupin 2 domain-containing protein